MDKFVAKRARVGINLPNFNTMTQSKLGLPMAGLSKRKFLEPPLIVTISMHTAVQ